MQTDGHEDPRRACTASRAETDMITNISGTIDALSPCSSSSTIVSFDDQIGYAHRFQPEMTTYYIYDKDGKVSATSTNSSLAGISNAPLDLSTYETSGDIVGAYLAKRARAMHQTVSPNIKHHGTAAYGATTKYINNNIRPNEIRQASSSWLNNDSYSDADGQYIDSMTNAIGHLDTTACSSAQQAYPNPEDIRHLYTLHGLLPFVSEDRKMNALNGPTLSIVEQDTGTVFAYDVPKKLLVLFLGRRTVSRFIKTLEREDTINRRGPATLQELCLPRRLCSKAAVRILVAWMIRACQRHTMYDMRSFNVPNNTYAACTLAQTLTLLDLRKDTYRVESTINNNHFTRPIFAVELEALWNNLGHENKFTCRAMRMVGQRLQEHERKSSRNVQLWNEMYELFRRHPLLEDHVRNTQRHDKHQTSPIVSETRDTKNGHISIDMGNQTQTHGSKNRNGTSS